MRRVVIMGAGGRDFHDFNLAFRDDVDVRVVAFTAAQIPGIAHRLYPASLAGPLYPHGIPIEARRRSSGALIRREEIDEVVLAYSRPLARGGDAQGVARARCGRGLPPARAALDDAPRLEAGRRGDRRAHGLRKERRRAARSDGSCSTTG